MAIILSGCGGRSDLAPVTEVKWQPYSKYQNKHTVQPGETLYAIAFRYDTDYRHLARLNHLNPPYSLRAGQMINIQGGSSAFRSAKNSYRLAHRQHQLASQKKGMFSPRYFFRSSTGWYWPAQGRIVVSFIPAQGKKGINIACKKGEKIRASSDGVVAYAGSGLTGYGNLIIIRHNNEFLTAYGNNEKNLVSEGQAVKAGQEIAVVGVIDHQYWGVHFEIRKKGIPVNPLTYLKKS